MFQLSTNIGEQHKLRSKGHVLETPLNTNTLTFLRIFGSDVLPVYLM